MTPDTLVREWFEQVWTQKNEAAIDRLMAADSLVHDLPTEFGAPLHGRDAFKAFYRRFVTAFPDMRIEVLRTVVEGDLVAVHCRVVCTHTGDGLGMAATGRQATFSGISIARVKDDQVVEGWNSFDFLSMYQQLELLPAMA